MMVARGLSRLAGLLCVLMAGIVFVAGTAYAASAPVIERAFPSNAERVWSSEVNRSTARIDAEINPSGADTTYHFEYGPDTSYGSSVPVPDGDIGSGTKGVEVGQLVTGLQPGGTYHYRIVATNSSGTTPSGDESFSTFPASTPQPPDTCPNAAYRVYFSAGLPDCRAYEMVSPVEKYGADIAAESSGQTLASERGDLPGEIDRVIFTTKTPFGETQGSGNAGYTQYVGERRPTGWVSRGITPTANTEAVGQIWKDKTELMEFSSDLGVAGLTGYSLPAGPPTARPKSENLYLENTSTGKLFAAVTDASHEGEPIPFPPFYLQFFSEAKLMFVFGKPELGGASSSLDVVTFMSRVNFVPQAKGFNYKAYVYEHGEVKLLGYLPNQSTPAPEGSKLLFEGDSERNMDYPAILRKDTVSTDGSRILFEVNELPGQIFMRKNGTTTVKVTESETSQPVTAENVELQAATPDLKHILFRTSTRLLDSAPEGGGLYMYTDSPDPQTESNLTYIGSAESVVGVSEDGRRVYYDAGFALNLWEAGQTRQVFPGPGMKVYQGLQVDGRVTPDGKELAFWDTAIVRSEETGPNSFHSVEITEMYAYNADTGTLKCVSCSTTGAAPTTGVETGVNASSGGTALSEPYNPRFLSSDGRYVFFNTNEALVPQDTNGVTDAYEYDTVTGKLSLLSSGTGEDGTWFVEASADGRDAFLATRQKLTRWDPDKLVDIYDARVEGGVSEPPLPALPCDGDACQGTPSAVPSFNTASGFTGLGNPTFAEATAKKKAKITPSQRLKRALAVCRKKPKRRQARCERLARKRYGQGRVAARNHRAGR